MKKIKYLYLLLLTPFMFAACDGLNSEPVFDDRDAFVAFKSTSASIAENADELKIPVYLTSLSGISTTVEFSIKDSTAVRGEHFELVNESTTLTFTEDAPMQYITIKPIDNDVFSGDIVFTIDLVNSGSVNLGNADKALVQITDDEHPLVFIFGTFTAVGDSYFYGSTEWQIKIEKDADDVSTVWISNFVPRGTNEKVYGTVNAEKTVLSIPVKQVIATTTDPKVLLDGYYGPDGEEEIPNGGVITALIGEDGTITIQDEFVSTIYEDEAGTIPSQYAYNAMKAFAVLTKN